MIATTEKLVTHDSQGKIARVLEHHHVPPPGPLASVTSESLVEAKAAQIALRALEVLFDEKMRRYAARQMELRVTTDCPAVLEPLVAARAREILAQSPLMSLCRNSSNWRALSLQLVRRRA